MQKLTFSQPPAGDIPSLVRYAYHELDVNCAKTTLMVLSQLFSFQLEPQVMQSATLLNGGGRSRAQCGLVEGALLFMGIYFGYHGLKDKEINPIGAEFVAAFKKEFGSIVCYDLRPGGFQKTDPPHLCEGLSVKAVTFSHAFIKKQAESRGFI